MNQYIDSNKSHITLVKEMAIRMRDPLQTKEIVVNPNNQNILAAFKRGYWSDLSISSGYPSVLLLFAELDRLFPNEEWDKIAHNYILKLTEEFESNKLGLPSLFGGLSGICFAIQQSSRGGTRYQKLLNVFNSLALEQTQKSLLIPFRKNLKSCVPSSLHLYDLMHGVVGVGLYGLKNLENPSFSYLVSEIIYLLISYTYPLQVGGYQVPGWYQSPTSLFLESEKQRYPNGYFNLGLSHGITGVLAFLSITFLNRIIINGQVEAIERIIHWIKKYRKNIDGLFFWDSDISFEEEITEPKQPQFYPNIAWSCGTPGIARSLFLAGMALKDEELKKYALETFWSVFATDVQDWKHHTPTFCQGIAGLLMTTHLMARDTDCPKLRKKVVFLKELLIEHYSQENPFGFKDLESTIDGEPVNINRAGILEGASGVLLTLLSLETNSHAWYFPFSIDF